CQATLIIFDGNIDPESMENLNRCHFLPFSLMNFKKYATLATVSKFGMVRFRKDLVTPDMLYQNNLQSSLLVPWILLKMFL
ncbi:hypothetical protein BY996DRAFT_6834104, partial [Phakopsora pachyrhizi]